MSRNCFSPNFLLFLDSISAEEAIEEGNLFDDDEDDGDEWDYYNHDRVCLCDPTDFNAGTCGCNYLGLSCNGKR